MAGLGEALMYLGQAAPGIGKSFDDSRRQREQDEIERQKAITLLAATNQETEANTYKQKQLEKTTAETERKKAAAENAFKKYTSANKGIEQAQAAGGKNAFKPGGYAGPLNEEYRASLGQLSDKKPLEMANQFELPYHAAADEGIKNTVEQLNKDETQRIAAERSKRIGGIGASSMAGSDDPDFIQRAIDMVDNYEENGTISPAAAKVLRARAAIKPAGVLEDLTAFEKPKIQKEQSKNIEIETAAEKSGASTRAKEHAERDVQRDDPMYSAEQANKISQNGMAVKNLQLLRDELAAGNIQYFDIVKKTGQFNNPKVNNAYQQVSEILGRGQSGAAIADHEWKNFGKEILNPQYLLTEQGKATAIKNLDDYIDRFYSNGELITSDQDWYQKYLARGSRGRVKVSEKSNEGKSSDDDIINRYK